MYIPHARQVLLLIAVHIVDLDLLSNLAKEFKIQEVTVAMKTPGNQASMAMPLLLEWKPRVQQLSLAKSELEDV